MNDEDKARKHLINELAALRRRVAELEDELADGRAAEKALKESGERFRTIFEHTFQFAGLVTIDGTLVEANRTALRSIGVEESEVIGKPFWETPWWSHSTDLQEKLRTAIVKAAEGEFVRFEATHPAAAGKLCYVDFSLKPLMDEAGKVDLLIPEGRDITERKLTEESLRETSETLQAIIVASPVAIMATDREGKVIKWSPAAERTFGWSEQDVIGRFDPVVPEDALDEFRADFRRVLGGEEYSREVRRQKKDGCLIDVSISTAPLRNAEGEITGAVAIMNDITERKRMEEVLRDSEAKYRRIVDTANEGIWSVDENFKTTFVNRRMARMLGYDEPEMIGRPVRWFMFEEDLDHLREKMRDRRTGISDRYERRYRHKDGRSVWVILSVTPLVDDKDGSFKGSFAMATDITERKRVEEERLQLEQRLHQAEKAESLGRMAGAIAHHFNSLLGAVMGRLELALGDLPQAPRPRKHLAEAMNASQRAADISRLMLTYLGHTVERKEPCNLVQAVREALLLLRPSLPQNVNVKMELPPEAVMIEGDKVHVEQALTNLSLNAAEAIGDDDGQIKVALEVVTAEKLREFRLFPSGWEPTEIGYASIAIADTGSGFDPDTMERIFDPFFSTKFAGRGLGLAVVLGIVRAHGGALAVESQAGLGSIFRVFFPLLARQTLHPGQEPKVDIEPFREGGLVLVVDDEPMVRDMSEAMLKSFGYEVIVASDGLEALKKFRERQDEVRLVLLDQSLPGMKGCETLAALRALQSDLRVVLTSGYDEEQVMRGDRPEQPQVFLRKPYYMKDLEAALDAALKTFPTTSKGAS